MTKLEWNGASNVAPKRRVDLGDRQPWVCACGKANPAYANNCTKQGCYEGPS